MSKKPTPTPPRAAVIRATLWLSQAGSEVQLWLARPIFVAGQWQLPEGASHLLMSSDGVVSAKFALWTREAVLKEFRVAPDTERELICVGGGAELKPASITAKA